MGDKMKVREGNDGYSYPYTSSDIVIDKNGKSNTTKFEELDLQLGDIATNKADKTTTQNIQQQVNNLVLGAVADGNNAEVVQARGGYDLLSDRFIGIDNKINKLYTSNNPNEYGFKYDYNNIDLWEKGTLNETSNGIKVDSDIRIRTKDFIDSRVEYIFNKNNATIFLFIYDLNGVYEDMKTYAGDKEYIQLDKNKKYKIVCKNNSNPNSSISVDFADNIFLFVERLNNEWVHGSLNDLTGEYDNNTHTYNTRLTIKSFLDENINNLKISSGYVCYLYLYDKNQTFIGYININDGIKLSKKYLYKIVIMREDKDWIYFRNISNAISFNTYEGLNILTNFKNMWKQGYFYDNGQASYNESSSYYKKRILTPNFIDTENINKITCEFPYKISFIMYDENDNFIHQSPYSDILLLPNRQNKYKLTLAHAGNKDITIDNYNKVKFSYIETKTERFNRIANFAPIYNSPYYELLQSTYDDFNKD